MHVNVGAPYSVHLQAVRCGWFSRLKRCLTVRKWLRSIICCRFSAHETSDENISFIFEDHPIRSNSLAHCTLKRAGNEVLVVPRLPADYRELSKLSLAQLCQVGQKQVLPISFLHVSHYAGGNFRSMRNNFRELPDCHLGG